MIVAHPEKPLRTPHARNGYGWAGVLGLWSPLGNTRTCKLAPSFALYLVLGSIGITVYNGHGYGARGAGSNKLAGWRAGWLAQGTRQPGRW